jgi:hypothetical protein
LPRKAELEEQRKLQDPREFPRREPREQDQRKPVEPRDQPQEEHKRTPRPPLKIIKLLLDQPRLHPRKLLPDQVPRKDQQRKAVLLKEDLKRSELR